MTGILLSLLLAAGSGSGGFGGGGGGGGGGSGGAGGGGSVGPWWLSLLIIGVIALGIVAAAVAAWRYRRRRRERVGRVELAAEEARMDDADFDPDAVRAAARELFVEIQRLWSEGDVEGLAERVGPDLMVEWRRRLDDFARKGWRNVVEVRSGPDVEYVGLVNRAGEAEDRVVVRVTARLEDFVRDRDGGVVLKDGERSTSTTLTEWWTLEPPGERWRLLSIEQEAEGRHHLDAPVVPVPWEDGRVRDEAVVEGAVAASLPEGARIGELADPDMAADARAAALDLASVDGRFAPDVLEAAVRRAVAGWLEAVDGDDGPLRAVASPGAAEALLYGDDETRRTRTVVRGLRVERVTIVALDAASEPARMVVEVEARGRRYVEDRDTADVVSGSKDADRRLAQRWTFALDGADATPWRLAEVASQASGPAPSPART